MTTGFDEEKLAHARWVLERNLHWIATSEVKIGVIIAIDTGLFGALAAAFNGNKAEGHYYLAHVSTLFAAILLAIAIACGALTIMPRTGGPSSSMIFFGRIAAKPKASFEDEFNQASATDLLADCLAQIHRNAEIAAEKFRWVIASMRWSLAAVPFWLLAIATIVKA